MRVSPRRGGSFPLLPCVRALLLVILVLGISRARTDRDARSTAILSQGPGSAGPVLSLQSLDLPRVPSSEYPASPAAFQDLIATRFPKIFRAHTQQTNESGRLNQPNAEPQSISPTGLDHWELLLHRVRDFDWLRRQTNPSAMVQTLVTNRTSDENRNHGGCGEIRFWSTEQKDTPLKFVGMNTQKFRVDCTMKNISSPATCTGVWSPTWGALHCPVGTKFYRCHISWVSTSTDSHYLVE